MHSERRKRVSCVGSVTNSEFFYTLNNALRCQSIVTITRSSLACLGGRV